MNKLFIATIISVFMSFGTVNAMTIIGTSQHTYQKEKAAAIKVQYHVPVRTKSVFQPPKPNIQQGATQQKGNEYTPKIERKDKYRPGYVFYEEKNCWLNMSVVPAITVENREMHLYYIGTNKEFVVHFRTPAEATAAHNILMKGLDCELPPYYVTEELL